MTDSTGIQARNITVRYTDDGPAILRDQSVVLPRGALSAFIGPNGSGKSTLLKAIARQLHAATGTILLDGADISEIHRRDFARRLGILFQENTAPSDLSVEELVRIGRYPHLGFMASWSERDQAAVERALELSGISGMRQRLVNQLSSGQRQLAWIAMVLAQETDYVLLDEPTTFLDLAHQFDVMDLLKELNRDLHKTVILVVHDLNLAARYADHIVALRNGTIVVDGCPRTVLTPRNLRMIFGVETRIIRDADRDSLQCMVLGKSSQQEDST